MQTEQIVALLIAERDRLNSAIQALRGTAKHRGRPREASNAGASAAKAPARKKRNRMSAAARKAQSERMRAFWAAKRKEKSK